MGAYTQGGELVVLMPLIESQCRMTQESNTLVWNAGTDAIGVCNALYATVCENPELVWAILGDQNTQDVWMSSCTSWFQRQAIVTAVDPTFKVVVK